MIRMIYSNEPHYYLDWSIPMFQVVTTSETVRDYWCKK